MVCSQVDDPRMRHQSTRPYESLTEPRCPRCAPTSFPLTFSIGKDLNQGYMNYVEPDSTSSTSEIAEILDETPGLERVRQGQRGSRRAPIVIHGCLARCQRREALRFLRR